ncbi:hypothetical protein COLO4_01636 [Corchorus olitorius]|uniref:Uncharacterized protein n=1 Tax=Corchorus olitorius TaxID=93759 RepID=A0A1R3L276_9ROSI|nr:hypothetical protein COLO4_01636 [Corchorus olitorius]
MRVLQLGEQLHGVAVVHVDARALERTAQRDDASIHVARNLVGGLEDVAHRHAFHRRRVVAHADQVADGAAASALAVVRSAAARQDGRAALTEQMTDCAVVDFLLAEILRLHVVSPDPRLQASPIRFTSDFRLDVASDVAHLPSVRSILVQDAPEPWAEKGPECKSFLPFAFWQRIARKGAPVNALQVLQAPRARTVFTTPDARSQQRVRKAARRWASPRSRQRAATPPARRLPPEAGAAPSLHRAPGGPGGQTAGAADGPDPANRSTASHHLLENSGGTWHAVTSIRLPAHDTQPASGASAHKRHAVPRSRRSGPQSARRAAGFAVPRRTAPPRYVEPPSLRFAIGRRVAGSCCSRRVGSGAVGGGLVPTLAALGRDWRNGFRSCL